MDGFASDLTPVTEIRANESQADIPRLAMSYIMYKIGTFVFSFTILST